MDPLKTLICTYAVGIIVYVAIMGGLLVGACYVVKWIFF